MGKNSQQRRADQKRRAARQRRLDGDAESDRSRSDTSLEHAVIAAAHLACGGADYKAAFQRAVAALVQIELDATVSKRPSAVAAEMLQRSIGVMYENGWQPADVAHTVRRQATLRAVKLVVAVIAADASTSDAVHRAPATWLSQLEDLGVYDPARAIIIGGFEDTVMRWARAERLYADETLIIVLQVLGQLLTSSRLGFLVDPPSKWGASNRGVMPKAARTGDDVDAKALKLIRALLAKAEATTFEAEADSFTAKAQEMMTRYSIDAAVLASAARNTGSGAPSGIESRRVHIDSPYADEKATFLSVIADVNMVRSVWSSQVGFSTVMGFPIDLHLTDVLFTSLLLQATKASAHATNDDRRLRTPSFRRAFLIAFAERIGERLHATQRHASAEAAQQYGAALVPILADREAAVTAAYEQAFPNVTTMPSRRLNAYGYNAGRAAADRAHIGAGEAITSG